MARHQGRPRRRITSDRTKYTIEVFSEGEKTEVQYLTAWHRQHRDQVVVRVAEEFFGCGPLQLVQAAVKRKDQAAREQRKGRGRAPDAYWCIFDVDEHPNLPEACQLAASNQIEVAVSNPCIELWLYLHYSDHRRWDHRREIQHALKECSGIDKILTSEHAEYLLQYYETARARAIALDLMHERNGAEDTNPSSGVWRLVDVIRTPPTIS